MNAHVTITTMNAEAIRARLDEIGRLERAHAARNLDVELAEVMRRGGDVDALEEKHLQAERVARRLRVERQALETELPAAIRRSGAEQMAQLEADHERDTVAMRKTIPELVEDWKVFVASLTAFGELQGAAFARADRAMTIAQNTGVSMPEIGNFKSRQVEDICVYLRDNNIIGILASIGTSAVNGKSTVID